MILIRIKVKMGTRSRVTSISSRPVQSGREGYNIKPYTHVHTCGLNAPEITTKTMAMANRVVTV